MSRPIRVKNKKTATDRYIRPYESPLTRNIEYLACMQPYDAWRKNVHRIYLLISFFFFLLRQWWKFCVPPLVGGRLKIPRARRFESIWQIGRFVRSAKDSTSPPCLTTESLALVVENSLYAASRTAAFAHADAGRACTRTRFICFRWEQRGYRRITRREHPLPRIERSGMARRPNTNLFRGKKRRSFLHDFKVE